MLRLPAGNLIASASSIGGSCKFLQVGRRQVHEHGQELVLQLDLMQATIQAATAMRAAAAHLGMVACGAAAKDLGDCLKRLPPSDRGGLMLDERYLDDLISSLEYLLRTFRDEIEARPLFAMSPINADPYAQPEPLFGAHVEDIAVRIRA